MPSYSPLINGQNYSWSDISVVLLGVPVVGITAITYKESQEKVNNYGAGDQPISRGRKNKVYTNGSLTLYVDELQAILQTAPNKDILNIPPFTIIVLFGSSKHVLKNCEFTEDPFDSKSGDSAITVSCPFSFAGLYKS